MRAKPIFRVVLALALALSGLAGAAEEPEVQGRKKSEWIRILKTDTRRNKRVGAVLALGILGPQKDILDAFGQILREEKEETVRQQVVGVLGGFRKEEMRPMIPQLAMSLREDTSPVIRAEIASVLGKLGDIARPALSALVTRLKDDDAATRSASAEAIGRLGVEAAEAIPSLLPLLRDKDSVVRFSSAFALGRLGPDATIAVADLSMLLAGDPAVEVRKEVARTLGSMGADAKTAVPALVAALKQDKSDEVRQQAALAVGRMIGHIEAALPDLKAILPKEADATVRLYLVRTIASALEARASLMMTDYAKLLGSERDGEVKLALIQELGAMGPDARDAIPALSRCLNDVQVPVRDAAKVAIARIKAPAKKKE